MDVTALRNPAIFSKLQITEPHDEKKIGDCSVIDNSKGYLSIKTLSQLDQI